MVHDDRYETHDGSEKFVTTFRKVHSSNCSQNLQICPKVGCPLVQKLGNKDPKSGGKKQTSRQFCSLFERLCFFLAVSPKDGAGGRGERLGVLQRRVGRGSSKEGMAL